jgi:hypothetical protein
LGSFFEFNMCIPPAFLCTLSAIKAAVIQLSEHLFLFGCSGQTSTLMNISTGHPSRNHLSTPPLSTKIYGKSAYSLIPLDNRYFIAINLQIQNCNCFLDLIQSTKKHLPIICTKFATPNTSLSKLLVINFQLVSYSPDNLVTRTGILLYEIKHSADTPVF